MVKIRKKRSSRIKENIDAKRFSIDGFHTIIIDIAQPRSQNLFSYRPFLGTGI